MRIAQCQLLLAHHIVVLEAMVCLIETIVVRCVVGVEMAAIEVIASLVASAVGERVKAQVGIVGGSVRGHLLVGQRVPPAAKGGRPVAQIEFDSWIAKLITKRNGLESEKY